MLDPLIIHELIFGEVDFPERMSSDISKLAWYARENNVSMEDLRIALENFKNTYEAITGEAKREYGWAVEIWVKTAEKAIEAVKKTQANLPILDTKLQGPNGKEYAAALSLETGKFAGVDNPGGRYWISVYQPFVDDEQGSTTGVPNAPYWSGTPASYLALDVLDWDHDRITIDGGQNWYVTGVREMIKELEEKHGDEIRKHDLAPAEKKQRESSRAEESFARLMNNTNESIRAKKVYEALSDVLKGKTHEQLIKDLQHKSANDIFQAYHDNHTGHLNSFLLSKNPEELLDYIPNAKEEVYKAIRDLREMRFTPRLGRIYGELYFQVKTKEFGAEFLPIYLGKGSFDSGEYEGWTIYRSSKVRTDDPEWPGGEINGLKWSQVLLYLEEFLKERGE